MRPGHLCFKWLNAKAVVPPPARQQRRAQMSVEQVTAAMCVRVSGRSWLVTLGDVTALSLPRSFTLYDSLPLSVHQCCSRSIQSSPARIILYPHTPPPRSLCVCVCLLVYVYTRQSITAAGRKRERGWKRERERERERERGDTGETTHF